MLQVFWLTSTKSPIPENRRERLPNQDLGSWVRLAAVMAAPSSAVLREVQSRSRA